MARRSKRKKGKSQRISHKAEARRQRKAKALAKMMGFSNASADNPFENTKIAKNASADAVTRMQRRFNSDSRRKQTFAENWGITKGYDAITSILGSAFFQMLKESTRFDSTQLIDLVKQFDEDIPPEVLEKALSTYMHELTLPKYVEIENIQEALDAGFSIEEAVEWAELNAVQTDVTQESAYVDIHDIIMELMRQMRENGSL